MPHSDTELEDDDAIVVHVVRTGGFAGLRREWTAEPDPDEAPAWVSLIEECPWEAATATARSDGADRFVWGIDARLRRHAWSVQLGDGDVEGPWRTLVDAVREFGAPARDRRPAADRGR